MRLPSGSREVAVSRYRDDPISTNVQEYYRRIAANVVRNMTTGNWDRAARWEEGWEFTAADVRWRAGDEPSPGAMGAAFRVAAQAKTIRFLRFQRSRRITRHGGTEGVWRGKGAT